MAETTAIAEQPSPQPEHTGPVVVFEHVSIAFEDNHILNDISFSVESGETRIVLGPAGCGKSVLMKLTIGLIKPDSGSIHVLARM